MARFNSWPPNWRRRGTEQLFVKPAHARRLIYRRLGIRFT